MVATYYDDRRPLPLDPDAVFIEKWREQVRDPLIIEGTFQRLYSQWIKVAVLG